MPRFRKDAPFYRKVGGKYGAPMGRDSDSPAEFDLSRPLHLQRVPLHGDYDPGGAYWGAGPPPLYCVWDDDGHERYARVINPQDLMNLWPDATWDYREAESSAALIDDHPADPGARRDECSVCGEPVRDHLDQMIDDHPATPSANGACDDCGEPVGYHRNVLGNPSDPEDEVDDAGLRLPRPAGHEHCGGGVCRPHYIDPAANPSPCDNAES